MRKFLSIIFVFSLMLFLYSCGHNHEYTSTVVESTCIEQGYTEHTCSCGDSYKDNYTNFKEHLYGSWVEFDNIGREERSCIVCGNIETRTMECTLTYVDLEGNTIKTETYDWGSQVVFDEPYEVEGSKFLGWSIYNDSVEIYKNYLITKDMTVYPVSTPTKSRCRTRTICNLIAQCHFVKDLNITIVCHSERPRAQSRGSRRIFAR